jgi:hypothetical protein
VTNLCWRNRNLAGDLHTNDGGLSIGTKTDGTADVVNLIIKGDFTGDNDTSAENVAGGSVTATITATTKVETLNVTSTGNDLGAPSTPVAGYKADYVTNTLALTDNALVTLERDR